MPLLSLPEARALVHGACRPVEPAALALAEACGRVLREDIVAPEDMPAFDRSAMDGYAIRADDTAERFRVVGEMQAGEGGEMHIGAGECARIYTGARLPAGATQVLLQEDVDREGEWMIPRQRDDRTWIRWRGEDARQGDQLLTAGIRLGAAEVSLLAQLGVTSPRVSPPPRVLHFATGNELVDPGTQPGVGQIRDSNSSLVAALVAESGARLVGQGRCGDTLEALVNAVQAHSENEWDVLLISGGASVGDYDFGVRALESLGFTVHFRQLNLRPGKPLVFATRGRQVAFVIPGNPVSHFVTYHVAIRLALESLEQGPPSWSLIPVRLAGRLAGKPDARETWWPARVAVEDGIWKAHPLAWQSSGDLRGIVAANALLPIAPGTGPIEAGTSVQVLLLSGAC